MKMKIGDMPAFYPKSRVLQILQRLFMIRFANKAIKAIMDTLPIYFGCMHMKTMTAVEAKNSFGRLLEATHREPVSVTKNNREIAAMFSMQDVQALADDFLAEPLKADVLAGKLKVVDALMSQISINKRLAASRKAIAEGRGIVADADYFAGLRERALARTS